MELLNSDQSQTPLCKSLNLLGIPIQAPHDASTARGTCTYTARSLALDRVRCSRTGESKCDASIWLCTNSDELMKLCLPLAPALATQPYQDITSLVWRSYSERPQMRCAAPFQALSTVSKYLASSATALKAEPLPPSRTER